MEDKRLNRFQRRREFVRTAGRLAILLPLGYYGGSLLKSTTTGAMAWQIDPYKCSQCGRCETHCVLSPSAVKCYHQYQMCGYCDLCGGYLRQGIRNIDTSAESQLCPTGAIKRTFIEDPYFEYTIIEELCIGCAKCVKGCADFGNGSLYLQINHQLCVNCNECSIARACPSHAIIRVPVTTPYLLKEGYAE